MDRWLFISFLVIVAAAPARAQETGTVQTIEPPASVSAELQQPAPQLIVNGRVLGEKVSPRAGEFCLVCDKPIGDEDVVYLVNGQRVALHTVRCYAVFQKEPAKFLVLLRPRGAFLGTSGEGQELSFVWFLTGLYVLLGLVFAALCAQHALSAGRNPVTWFVLGMGLNAIGYLLLLTRPKLEVHAPGGVPEGLVKVATTFAPLPCPNCGGMNHPAANQCAACRGKLQPVEVSEVGKAGLHPR